MKKTISLFVIFCMMVALYCFGGCAKTEGADETTAETTEYNLSEDTDHDADTTALDSDTTIPANNEAEVETARVLEESERPVITLTADKTEVSAGDKVTAVLNIGNAKYLATVTVSVGFDGKAIACTDFETHSVTDFYDISNQLDEQVIYSGYVMTTVNMIDQDVAEIEFKVNDDVQSGDEITLSVDVPEFKLGTDESGDTIYDVATQVKAESVVLTVK